MSHYFIRLKKCNLLKIFRYSSLLLIVLIFSFIFSLHSEAKPIVRLVLWTHQRHMADLTKEFVREFNEKVGHKKGIYLSLRIVGDDSQHLFQEAQKNNQGPDLYSSGLDIGYADPIKEKARITFDNLPGFKKWKSQWPSWYWIEGLTTYQGKVYAIPTQVVNSRLIYNRDLFRKIGRDPDKPPRSYDEVEEIARLISDNCQGKAYGFAYCAAETWPFEWMPSQWAEANGEAAYWDWKNGRWAIQGFFRVFELLLKLQKAGSLFPGSVTLTNEALRAQFAEGRIGMFMGEFWDIGVLTDQFPAKCDWGVGPIPTYDGKFHGKSRAMMLNGFWCINGQSRHKLEAWEVVKWFSRYEIRAKIYEQGKCIDPDPKVSGRFRKNPPKIKGFSAFAETLNQDYLATYPILPGWNPPEENPFTLLRDRLTTDDLDLSSNIMILKKSLDKLEMQWNQELLLYYMENLQYKRGWNIYPQFNRLTGKLGKPLIKPVFKSN